LPTRHGEKKGKERKRNEKLGNANTRGSTNRQQIVEEAKSLRKTKTEKEKVR
jgi:hypothetical protein